MDHLNGLVEGIGIGIVGMLFFVVLRLAEIRNALHEIRDAIRAKHA